MEKLIQADNLVQEGLIYHKNNEIDLAFVRYNKALALNPNQAGAHNLLADIHYRLGNNIKALYHSNLALSLNRDPHFLNTRGMIFIGMKRFDDALSDLRAALKLDATFPEIHNNLGIAYRNLKDFKKAKIHAMKAVELRPEFLEGLINLAAVTQDAGDLQSSLGYLQKALVLDSQNIVALANLAKIYYLLGEHDSLITYSSRAMALGYTDLDLYFPTTEVFIKIGKWKEGAHLLAKGFQEARPAAYVNLDAILAQGVFFKTLYDCCQYLVGVEGEVQTAINMYEKSIKYAPAVGSSCWINLSSIYFQIHNLHEAIHCCEEAIKLDARQIWGYNNTGVCYINLGESKKAIDSFEKALAIQADFAPSLGWLLKEKGHICDWSHYESLCAQVDELRNTNNDFAIAPFTALSVYDDPEALLYWARLNANYLFDPAITAITLNGDRGRKDHANRKIRIGYYSFDFRNHPVAHLTARLFETHDHDVFDIYAYSYGPDDGSAVRERIKANVKEFVDVRDLSTIDTARRIAEDDIDVLIDLTGNTLNTRSQIFALRPARIQAHWLGFVGTMGSAYYDYIIADDIVIPPGDEPYFAEKILRLPSGMHIMDDSRNIETGHQTRVANSLPDSGIVFGCFCQTLKIQPEIFSAWMKVLKAVPESVLWLASGPKGAIENLQASAEAYGIEAKRIIVAQRCEMEEYLSRFALIDIYLDTFPYTSGTVASDALLMGCPLLTLSGKTMVSRMAGSILTHAGLPELVAYNQQEYIQKAIDLAKNHQERSRIRERLLTQSSANTLLNTRQSVQELEEIIKTLLEKNGLCKTSDI